MGPYLRWAWRICATRAPVNPALTKFNATDKADKQLKRFERHVKRDVSVVHVRRFVLLVDNWTQTGARPPMIDHATQTWQVFQLSLII